MTLHYAHQQLGIAAQPRAVDLVVRDNRHGTRVLYGKAEPSWEDDAFHGRCIRWLPGSRRIIDPTVEQPGHRAGSPNLDPAARR